MNYIQAFTNCVHVTCTQKVLHVHENSCTLLIHLRKKSLNLLISHRNLYAFENKNNYYEIIFNFQQSSPESLQP